MNEQRQLVAQWKRKTQKAQGEMNDTKLMLEEQVKSYMRQVSACSLYKSLLIQTSRNVLLEKKQRKFDLELGSLQEERRQETQAREKVLRELDEIKRQKYSLQDQIQVSAFR